MDIPVGYLITFGGDAENLTESMGYVTSDPKLPPEFVRARYDQETDK